MEHSEVTQYVVVNANQEMLKIRVLHIICIKIGLRVRNIHRIH